MFNFDSTEFAIKSEIAIITKLYYDAPDNFNENSKMCLTDISLFSQCIGNWLW